MDTALEAGLSRPTEGSFLMIMVRREESLGESRGLEGERAEFGCQEGELIEISEVTAAAES
jgi:hypothetical protein